MEHLKVFRFSCIEYLYILILLKASTRSWTLPLFVKIQYLMEAGRRPQEFIWAEMLRMRGRNNGGTGGQWINAWELHCATWMLKGKEIYSLMKPSYDSHQLPGHTISNQWLHFHPFTLPHRCCPVFCSPQSTRSAPLFRNLFSSCFSLSSLSDLKLLVTESRGLRFLPANTRLLPTTPTCSRAHSHTFFSLSVRAILQRMVHPLKPSQVKLGAHYARRTFYSCWFI